MKVVYYEKGIVHDPKKLSIILIGPTPRTTNVQSWRRPEALDWLSHFGFNGTVYVPEEKNKLLRLDWPFEEIVNWEQDFIDASDVATLWLPRDLTVDETTGKAKMPAFTTNVEFGLYVKSGKLVYGRPDDTAKTKYLDTTYRKYTGRQPLNTLKDTIKTAIDLAEERHNQSNI